MPIAVIRLGSPRLPNEGMRLGTVRRPPRGVLKSEYAKRDFFDVWFPNLAPSKELLADAKYLHEDKSWTSFKRHFKAEMMASEPARILDVLAALSKQTNFSLGCYCENENRCHRSILKELLLERGASLI